MLDEEMDDIIRNAADKHHPAYNDKAWDKMLVQLDKHLPQKTDRRRPIFFLLLFLLLGGGIIFSIIHFTGNKTSAGRELSENVKDKQPSHQPLTKTETPVTDNTNNTQNQSVTDQVAGNSEKISKDLAKQENDDNRTAENAGKNKRKSSGKKGKTNMIITAANPSGEFIKEEKQNTKDNMATVGKTDDKMNIAITAAEPESNKNDTIDEQKEKTVRVNDDKKQKDTAARENKTAASPDKKKSKKNIAGNFGITISAGPDISFIELNKLGKVTMTYGAGLSYSFAKRVTVRTGFYASKKIYSASPDQYHTPGGNYPYLYNVDANCKVYEIPVSVSYNFSNKNDHSWFGGVGLSSFLMKKENYVYQYKAPYGQTYNYKTEISNENQHYFAVLTLSGGYQYQFDKRVSLQAEPYVKLPLSGIGQGKVNLNSSGILFTVTVKPFAKRK